MTIHVDDLLATLLEDPRIEEAWVDQQRSWRATRFQLPVYWDRGSLIVLVNTADHGSDRGIPGGNHKLASLTPDARGFVESVDIHESAPYALVKIVTDLFEEKP
jgi:hypothetical protein